MGLKTQNMAQLTRIDQLEKKLEILQNTSPNSQAQTKSNNKDNMRNRAHKNNDQVHKASTPPSSCEELAMLNQYLDGLYLVKKQAKQEDPGRFLQISC